MSDQQLAKSRALRLLWASLEDDNDTCIGGVNQVVAELPTAEDVTGVLLMLVGLLKQVAENDGCNDNWVLLNVAGLLVQLIENSGRREEWEKWLADNLSEMLMVPVDADQADTQTETEPSADSAEMLFLSSMVVESASGPAAVSVVAREGRIELPIWPPDFEVPQAVLRMSPRDALGLASRLQAAVAATLPGGED